MRRAALATILLAVLEAGPAMGQGLAVGGSLGSYALSDSPHGGNAGIVLGMTGAWHRGRLGVRLEVARASLTPDDPARVPFTVMDYAGHLTYAIGPALDAEIGVVRRSITPTFAAQDVGGVSIGARSATQIGPWAGVWVRAALLPIVRFNGGGSSGTAVEVSVGTWLAIRTIWRVEVDYRLQRIDRTLNGTPLPMQLGVTRVGISLAR